MILCETSVVFAFIIFYSCSIRMSVAAISSVFSVNDFIKMLVLSRRKQKLITLKIKKYMKSRCFFFNFKYYVEFIVRTFSISTPVYIESKF